MIPKIIDIPMMFNIGNFKWREWRPVCYVNAYKVFPNARFGTKNLVILEKDGDYCMMPISNTEKFGKEYNIVIKEWKTDEVYK